MGGAWKDFQNILAHDCGCIFQPLTQNNFLAIKFFAKAIFKLFQNIHFPWFGAQIIFINQILPSSVRYAKLKAISNLFIFCVHPVYTAIMLISR